MIKAFEPLNEDEYELMLKAPALVSLLAAGTDNTIDENEEEEAIKLAHLRTFTSEPLLHSYYEEVEKVFASEFRKLADLHMPLNKSSRKIIEKELKNVSLVLGKLERKFAETLQKSLNSYSDHVNKADRHFMEYFVLPLNIPGITD